MQLKKDSVREAPTTGLDLSVIQQMHIECLPCTRYCQECSGVSEYFSSQFRHTCCHRISNLAQKRN